MTSFVSEQATRYRQRFGGRRIPLPPKVTPSSHPDLIPSPTSAVNDETFILSAKRVLEMQLSLEKSLSSLDVSQITIGVNQAAQSPQDIIQSYCQGIQTDLMMVNDVSTETRRTSLDSSVQCNDDTLEMYTQTEKPFMKTKNVQTEFIKSNSFTQTDRLKMRNAIVQTAAKLYNDKCEQASKSEMGRNNISTETDTKIVYNKGTLTEDVEVYDMSNISMISNNDNGIDAELGSILDQESKEKSESPPLSPDKEIAGPSAHYSFPFVSLFNPLAVMLPSIGTYNFVSPICFTCCFLFK